MAPADVMNILSGVKTIMKRITMTTDELISVLEAKFEPGEILTALCDLAAVDEADFYEWIEPLLDDHGRDLLEMLIDE
jgi:hypothetical protein